MSKSLVLALVASCTMAAPAIAGDPYRSSNKAQRSVPKSPDQVICERGRATGSMIVRTTCKTRAEWVADGAKLPRNV